MREIRTSGLMSGDGKRGVAKRPKPPRPSSTPHKILGRPDKQLGFSSDCGKKCAGLASRALADPYSLPRGVRGVRVTIHSTADLSLRIEPAKNGHELLRLHPHQCRRRASFVSGPSRQGSARPAMISMVPTSLP
jgi:hypothetical protein